MADVGGHLGELVVMLQLGLAHLPTQQGLGKESRGTTLPCRELATAILLVVEVVLVQQLVATLLQTSLAPVLRPEMKLEG